ncbi:uncharacterized protein LOC131234594 [Magnolia sinica]|uniref:uncharacterized protein LOC131234594 n=1 Tax=Magnolia sinica TaxID=86752 RepID=UPI0026593939|nr:uncharacterized protein LOC131234594 [Magnolia sinica]
MDVTSENVAHRYGVTRQEQDQAAVLSHKKAATATASGKFKDEIIPVATKVKFKMDYFASLKSVGWDYCSRSSHYQNANLLGFEGMGMETLTKINSVVIVDPFAAVKVSLYQIVAFASGILYYGFFSSQVVPEKTNTWHVIRRCKETKMPLLVKLKLKSQDSLKVLEAGVVVTVAAVDVTAAVAADGDTCVNGVLSYHIQSKHLGMVPEVVLGVPLVLRMLGGSCVATVDDVAADGSYGRASSSSNLLCVLPLVAVGSLSAGEAEARTNVSAGEKV